MHDTARDEPKGRCQSCAHFFGSGNKSSVSAEGYCKDCHGAVDHDCHTRAVGRDVPTTPNRPVTSEAPSRVMGVPELAAILNVNIKTIYAGIHAGEIPGVLRIGRTVRLSRDKVERWLAGEDRATSSKGVRR